MTPETELALQPAAPTEIAAGRLSPHVPLLPWRDPHRIAPGQLAQYIRMLEEACRRNPRSADLRTCLGIAHAVNYDVYGSMDALEAAVQIAPGNFFAQLKYAELFYRLRILHRAEEETLKAMDLASNGLELGAARKQLTEIRRLVREGVRRPAWTESIYIPAATVCMMLVLLLFAVVRP